MPKHARRSRTARRVAAIGATGGLALALTAGTAAADDDERCEDPHGVVVACTSDEVIDVDEIDLDVLTHDEDEGWGFPPVHLGP